MSYLIFIKISYSNKCQGILNGKVSLYHEPPVDYGISCMTTDNFVFICKTDQSKLVKQEVNSTVILLPLVFPEDAVACSSRGSKLKQIICLIPLESV
jgi:hypothetical protein